MTRRLLRLAGGELAEHRLASCGFSMTSSREFVKQGDDPARLPGVTLCAMGRVCPVCGPAEAAVRAAEVGAAAWRWLEDPEHSALFVSISASHKRGDVLAEQAGYLLDARLDVLGSENAGWRRMRRRFGIVDRAWKFEVSYGENGPHPGLHLVLLLDRHLEAREVDQLDAWLTLSFRASMAALGYRGHLSISNGVDIAPVDDPAGVGRYLTKWGVGAELACEAGKLGRNGTSMPYQAIPCVLALELCGKPVERAVRTDRRTAELVGAWREFVDFAVTDRRKWFGGFRRTRKLVPELAGASTRVERIAVCTELLPEELRPLRAVEVEQDDDSEDGEGDGPPADRLSVDGAVWQAVLRAWRDAHSRRLLPEGWLCWLRSLGLSWGPRPVAELAVCWLIDDLGIEAAAGAVAALVGAEVVRAGPSLWRVTFDDDDMPSGAGLAA